LVRGFFFVIFAFLAVESIFSLRVCGLVKKRRAILTEILRIREKEDPIFA
jgi:hypothetical protein